MDDEKSKRKLVSIATSTKTYTELPVVVIEKLDQMESDTQQISIFRSALNRLSLINATTNTKSNHSVIENGGKTAPRRSIFGRLLTPKSKDDEMDDAHEPSLVCSLSESPYYIYKACAQGLTDVIHVMLAENPKRAREHDLKGLTCLHHAALRGKCEIIKILLDRDADINAKDQEGNTPLHLASEKGQPDAVRMLLTAGADGNLLNEGRLAAIHLAVIADQLKVLEVLVQFPNQVDINCRGAHGKNPLHWAAKYDHDECAEILLRHGAKFCGQCDFGFYPIHVAAIRSSTKTLETLLKFAEQNGYTRERMLSYADKEANSPLHLAVNSGNYDVVLICLDHGARIDARQESQATPFHFACSQGTLATVRLMFEHHLKTCDHENARLILSARDNAEMTPLHRAAMFDHVQVVQYLIEQGSDIDAIDRDKCSPLLLAAARGATRSIRLLLEAGSNVTIRDINKRHLLHFSIIYNYPKHHETMDLVERICQSEEGKRLLNMKDNFGCTPLHVASKEGNLKLAEILIKLGAIVNLKDNDDQSPLHFAARYGRYNTVRRLLESPAGPNILNETDAKGMTALHVASMNGHTKVAQLLLEKGALIHKNWLGRTPLHVSAMSGYTQTMKMLLAFHATLLDQKCKKGYTALHYACEENQAPAAELLLSSNCAYCKNDDDHAAMDIAVIRRNAEVAMVMVQHDRWKEILHTCSSIFGCPLLGMIQHLPDVHKVKYNFEYMQIEAAKLRELRSKGLMVNAKPLNTLNTMVRYGRVELLSHPVCLNYLQMKWRAYGMWFFLVHIFLYMTFVLCLTVSIVRGKMHDNSTVLESNSSYEMIARNETETREQSLDCRLASMYLFIFAIANILKEIVQMYQQRLRYFLDYVNYIEWTMYVTAIIFSGQAFHLRIAEQCIEWQCGSVAVFLAWFNLLLYLQRLDTVGLFVVMFLQILHTVVKVIIVFSVLFIAFGLSFYMLLSATPNGSFKTPLVAILSAVMQLMGEYNYVDVYIRPYLQLENTAVPLHYATLNFIFLVVFVVLMPILFVNLLIGLAVGDIEMVQKDAQLKRLAMQVEYHTELEEKLPLWIIGKVDKIEMTVHTNMCAKSGTFKSKIVDAFCSQVITARANASSDSIRKNALLDMNNDMIAEDLENMRRRMKEMQTKSDTMHDLLRLIVQKMEIVTEADAYDEGRRGSDDDDRCGQRRRGLRLRAKIAPLTMGKSMHE